MVTNIKMRMAIIRYNSIILPAAAAPVMVAFNEVYSSRHCLSFQ